MIIRTYSELKAIKTFEDRFQYLKLSGNVGDFTFGGHRYLNQLLYKFPEWKDVRRKVIIRDCGYDLGHPDYVIGGNIYVHHMTPITAEDILERRPCVFDLNNLISCSFETHNAIHYGDVPPKQEWKERTKYDTCPWR